MTTRGFSIGLAAALVGATAWAQTPPQDAAVDAPEVNPMRVVMSAAGIMNPVLTHTRRHRGAQPVEETVALRVVRGRCYEVVGHATGAAPTTVRVAVRDALIGSELTLTNSIRRVMRQRFCVDQPGELYNLRVRAEGDAWWYFAVVPLEAAVTPRAAVESLGVAQPSRTDTLHVPNETHPVGGTETDYIARQIQQYGAQRPGLLGFTPVHRGPLPTNGAREVPLTLPSGRCIDVVAVGVPSIGDLVVELEDAAGHRVAQDATHRNVESLRYCPSYAGTFKLRVRVFSGAGLVGFQTLIAR